MTMEVENQFEKLETLGPSTEGEKWQVAELDKGRKKMEEVGYKTYCKGHDHCAQARRTAEAKRDALAKKKVIQVSKMEAVAGVSKESEQKEVSP